MSLETPHSALEIAIFLATCVLPFSLIIMAWKKTKGNQAILALLTLQAVFFFASFVLGAREALLGARFTARLPWTILINGVLALLLAGMLGYRRQWWGFGAGLLLALYWFGVFPINLPWI